MFFTISLEKVLFMKWITHFPTSQAEDSELKKPFLEYSWLNIQVFSVIPWKAIEIHSAFCSSAKVTQIPLLSFSFSVSISEFFPVSAVTSVTFLCQGFHLLLINYVILCIYGKVKAYWVTQWLPPLKFVSFVLTFLMAFSWLEFCYVLDSLNTWNQNSA